MTSPGEFVGQSMPAFSQFLVPVERHFMPHPPIRRPSLRAVALALATLLPAALAAQATERVTVVGAGTTATVSWAPVAGQGVTYRVLRGLDAVKPGVDLTKPIAASSLIDPKVEPGVTYFYQVIAVYEGVKEWPADPVAYTAPRAAASPVAIASAAVGTPLAGGVQTRGSLPAPAPAPVPALTAVSPRAAPPPAPAGLSVTGTPAAATVAWQPLPGVASFLGVRKLANAPDVEARLAPANTGWYDPGLQPATTYTYRISALYPDGRSASREIQFTTPPAVNPAGLTAQLTAPGQVRLSWQGVAGASHYVVFGPGSAAGGVKVSGATSYAVTGVPAGTQEWAVASYYEPGPVSSPGAAFSRVSLVVVAPVVSGRYRITMTGLRAIKASYDDQLSRDGMGDEVYAATFIRRYDRRTGAVAEFTSRRTLTYGDTKFFGARVQAGKWSGTGGIRDFDPVPDNFDPSELRLPGSDTAFPWKLWEGTLTDGVDALVFSPSLWEEDGSTQLYAIWNQQMTSITSSLFANPAIQSQIAGKRFGFVIGGSTPLQGMLAVAPTAPGTAGADPQVAANNATAAAAAAEATAAAAAAEEKTANANVASAVGNAAKQAAQKVAATAAAAAAAASRAWEAAKQTAAAAAAAVKNAATAAVAAVRRVVDGGVDRPIGVLPSGANDLVLPHAMVVLTREIIEAGLAPLPPNTPLLGLPAAWPRMPKPGVIMVPLQDGAFTVGLIPVAPARYELYLTVERIP
jgi:hypothetical protein